MRRVWFREVKCCTHILLHRILRLIPKLLLAKACKLLPELARGGGPSGVAGWWRGKSDCLGNRARRWRAYPLRPRAPLARITPPSRATRAPPPQDKLGEEL